MKIKASTLLFFFISLSTFAFGQEGDIFIESRRLMVEKQLRGRGITDQKVLDAMMMVERHLFVPRIFRRKAYDDTPLPIGHKQTISQPYIVAFMTEKVALSSESKVLEIGTGSGYQTAVLAEIAKEVFSIEILKPLADLAEKRLESLGYVNVTIRQGSGYKGWPEYAPFDAIIVTAAPNEVPEVLIEELKVGGRMVIPVGREQQTLFLITKTADGFEKESLAHVNFVPMVHE